MVTLTLSEEERFATLRALQLVVRFLDLVEIAKSLHINTEYYSEDCTNRAPLVAGVMAKLVALAPKDGAK